MVTLRRSLLVLLVIALSTSAFGAEPFMPRYPAISPDGSTLLFSFQGDIWKVPAEGGTAMRLTAHPAYDAFPVFSNDGKWIAFGSNRYGSTDVFVMPLDGGPPRRLTYASTTDLPQAFSADNSTVYFAARRMFDYPMNNQILAVPATGGTPFRLADMFADEAAVTPDGKRFILGIGRVKFGRLHYRGSFQRDIWGYTPGSDPVQLTTFNGFDMNPMVGPDGRVWWINDGGPAKTQNLWVMNPDGSGKTQVTTFVGDGVRSAKLSAEGRRIVLEQGTSIFTLATTSGAKPVPVKIDVADDQIVNPIQIENKTADADEVAASSDGEELALVVHGEIVLVNKELGGRAAVPIPSPARDDDVSFRPGGTDTLAFVTDRFGHREVCLLVSDDPDESNLRLAKKHRIVRLVKGDKPSFHPVWSPKGDKIAYIDGIADLHVMDADGSHDVTLFHHWSEPSFSWSPDGRWIAFSREDRNYNLDVWVMPSDGSEKPVNISQHPKIDTDPVWSADGSMLAWSSNRHANQFDVYYVYLTRADDEKTKEEWEVWEKTRDKKKKNGKDNEKGEKEDEKKEEGPEVKIDFKDIHLRVRRATTLPGDEFVAAIHPKGDKIYFTASVEGKRDLYSVNRFGHDLTALTSGGTNPKNISFDPAAKTFYFLKGGRPASMGMDGGKVEPTSFTARITVNKPAERVQVLDEGWRYLGENYYDPDMHGVDWDGLHAKYKDWAAHVASDRDFADVVNLMLGEINSSHMGYYPDWNNRGHGLKDGYLGLDFDPSYKGDGLKVTKVLPNGPCDKVKSTVDVGDILLTVNGLPVSATENVFRALADQGNVPTTISLRRGRKTIDFEVVPVTYRPMRQLVYEEYEHLNRAHVEEMSKGKVGYVHIQGMSMPEVERFEMNLYAAADKKDALVIDVRNNGGGWTTDYLLTILTQPVHAITQGRNGEIGYPQDRYPLYRWSKPIAVICNENSYSNAEIFSHAVQTIDRGPLVGNSTGGNVISTGGWTTLDGGWIRLPGRGWFVWGDKKHPERNYLDEEGNGAVPDYLVPYTPGDQLHQRDPQLDKATELMMEAAKTVVEPDPSKVPIRR